MNTNYLDALPEITNKFDFVLQDKEKVVFNAVLDMFGTENDSMLGVAPKFALTNQRILVDNGAGFWSVDIPQDIKSCRKVEYSNLFGLFKGTYFALDLKGEIVYDYGRQSMTGFRFYFRKSDIAKFNDIINNL